MRFRIFKAIHSLMFQSSTPKSRPPEGIDLSKMVYLVKPPDSFLVFKTSSLAIVKELRKYRWATKRLFWDNEVAEHVTGSCIVEWTDGVVTVEQKVVGGEERAAALREKLREEKGIMDPDLQFVGMVRGREMCVSSRQVGVDDVNGQGFQEDMKRLIDLDEYDGDAWALG
ncbi:hypothetical protein BDV96DRAFT_204613 [Lophiotrema nucula]|uniref:Uncharacterized protein n=1 Tax=Lophiotrema nucula TaxID=690887 RepID=A0A6A5ZQ70_9PLEO|nr:hypothetical protein BDV96DRAFT_204613 [Lophiotrema nucula]